ncbi:MAG TPA: permease [Acetobacteraceae bacterium]|nr:permease [Acetobacteraceae bacterium]
MSDTAPTAARSLRQALGPRISAQSAVTLLRSPLPRVDFVLVTLGTLFLGLSACSAAQAESTLLYVTGELGRIAPWLAASVIVAAAARATGADALVARAFTGRQGRMIVVASLIGALLPFCSCGVIPLVAGLLSAGVPLAPVMAFWIASPLMDPTQFIIASGTLGISFAVAKLVGAIGMGLLSGFGTMALIRIGWLDAPAALRIAPSAAKASCCGSTVAPTPVVTTSCCGSSKQAIPLVNASSCCVPRPSPTQPDIIWRFWTDASRSQRFLTTATTTGWFLVRWLAVAYALESLMVAWLPVDAVGNWLGAGAGLFAVPVAVAIGIPVYLNSFAAIPVIGAKPRADYGELRFVPILSAVTMADFRYSASRPSIMLHLRAPGFCPYYPSRSSRA